MERQQEAPDCTPSSFCSSTKHIYSCSSREACYHKQAKALLVTRALPPNAPAGYQFKTNLTSYQGLTADRACWLPVKDDPYRGPLPPGTLDARSRILGPRVLDLASGSYRLPGIGCQALTPYWSLTACCKTYCFKTPCHLPRKEL